MRIDALLLDLDGVLYIGDRPIAGAAEALRELRARGIPIAGVTNTTTQPRAQIAAKLARLGMPLPVERILTPAALACARIGARRAWLCVRRTLREDFVGVHEDEASPEVVVMGDVGGDGYPPALLQRVFRHVFGGAELLALHKNRFWQMPDGLRIDLGGWVAAIEYAAGVEATVLGKPAAAFFAAACDALGARPEHTLMVGDDIEADVGGAQRAGLIGCLVETGKYRPEFAARSGVRPDLQIASIADLPRALDERTLAAR